MVLDGKLTNKVKLDDSMWNVDRETSTLCINLEKVKEIMWKSVLEGEEGIDVTKVCVCVCVCIKSIPQYTAPQMAPTVMLCLCCIFTKVRALVSVAAGQHSEYR